MFLRFAILTGFILSIGAALGSFSIFSSYQTERQLRLDAESKLIQVQDTVSSSEQDADQNKAKISGLESEVEKLKAEQDALKSEAEAKSGLVQQLQEDLNLKKSEIESLTQKIQEMKNKAVVAPVLPSLRAAEEKASALAVTGAPVKTAPVQAAPAVSAVASQPSTPAVTAPVMSDKGAVSSESESAGDTRILTVNRKFNFIVINLGLKDGLRMGDKVEVVQGETQKALAQVEKIYDKFSAATLLSEDKGNPVHEGDAIRKI